MEKLVFFGATGNSGIQLVEYLKSAWDYEIYCVGRKDIQFSDGICYVKGDLCDMDLYDKLPKDVDVVINFAGVQPSILPYSEETDFPKTIQTYIDVNIKGVWRVLEYARKQKVSRYIYATSHRDIEASWVGGGVPLKEDIPFNPNYGGDHAMYAVSKISGLMMGDYYGEKFGFKVYNLRFPMVFSSPKSNWYFADGRRKLIPFVKVLYKAYLGDQLEVWGDPDLKRDYVHISNMFSIVERLLLGKATSGIYNVGTQEAVTTDEFIKQIAEVFNPEHKKSDIIYCPEKHTYKQTTYSIEKCVEELGYEPVLLRDMLHRIKADLIRSNAFEQWDWDV
jgi:UDP-glucose 4-epimerase